MPIRTELGTIADLEAGARVIPTGTDLYRQGDICSTYFIVLSGWIALSVLLDDCSCQILDFALPGAILGFQQAPDAPMYHSARCLSNPVWPDSWSAISPELCPCDGRWLSSTAEEGRMHPASVDHSLGQPMRRSCV
jgi:hypothetical protein